MRLTFLGGTGTVTGSKYLLEHGGLAPGRLRARRALIDIYQQAVVCMRSDCAVCRAEGFEAQAQVEVVANGRQVLAILHRVEAAWLGHDEAALSEAAWGPLALQGGEAVTVRHAAQLESLQLVRAKVYGRKLDYASMRALIDDVSHGRVSDLHLAAFVTACAGGRPTARPQSPGAGLLFVADALRELGAASVGLVAPYLPYMRQDLRFRPGEAIITSRSFAKLVSAAFAWLVTVDPHLHRHASLGAIYAIPTAVVPSAPAIAAWVQTGVKRPHLIGPDEESAQWVSEVAALAGCPHTVLRKQRRGDRAVELILPDLQALR